MKIVNSATAASLEEKRELSVDIRRLVRVSGKHRALALTLMVAVTGCAAPAGQFTWLRTGVEDTLIPHPPDVPRYRYAGRLLGQSNVRRGEGSTGATRIVRWLVGIDDRRLSRRDLRRPVSGLLDSRGRIVVVDAAAAALFVFDPQKQTVAVWDSATGLQLGAPVAVAELPDGSFLVSDADQATIHRLDSEGRFVAPFERGATLQRPTGLVFSPESGRVFVSDTGTHRVLRFFSDGTLDRVIGGPGTQPGQFNAPTHLAIGPEGLLVSDTYNARVQHLSLDGEPLRTLGTRGLYVGNLTRPKGVTFGFDDEILVVESLHDHVLVFGKEGDYRLPIGGSGVRPGEFHLPAGIWTDGRARVFVADMFNARVEMFDFLGAE